MLSPRRRSSALRTARGVRSPHERIAVRGLKDMTGQPGIDAMVRRMVERTAPDVPRGAEAYAVQAACEQTYRVVARSVGRTGAHALLTRAVGKATVVHPALANLHIEGISELGLGGVSEIVRVHGQHTTTVALEAVLESFLGSLSHLIGDDLVAKLLEQASPESPRRQEPT